MDKNPADEIAITAMMKRFAEQRLPRAMQLKKKVSEGGTLNDTEMMFLETVFNDAKYVLPFSDKYPEYQELVTKAIDIYTEITQQALNNQKNQQKGE